MGENIFLSQKEARRLYVIEQTIAGNLTIRQAAEVLNLSCRQVKRLKKGVASKGAASLAHKNRSRKPKHAFTTEVRDLVVSSAVGEYKNASCEQIAELLAERNGIAVSARSVRRILHAAGIPLKYARKPTKKRRSRERMPAAGMLVQADASSFAWFEDRGPISALHGIIDDATGHILALFFRPTESLLGYFTVLLQMLIRFGAPQAFYSDRHTIFFSPKKDKLTIEDELAGKKVALTQFGRALSELGIVHIDARSPQAKGRVERLWETLQGRLVIELRLAGISSIEAANAFLPGFIAKFNARFGNDPAVPESAFAPCPARDALDRIVCRKETRIASGGSTISFMGRMYQLLTKGGSVLPLSRGAKIEVLTHLDGALNALHNGRPFELKELPAVTGHASQTLDQAGKLQPKKPYSPPATHPWRQPPRKRKPNSGESPYDGFWEDVYAV
ncbi:MAG: ISNCY family transposase [Bacteroidota bacterium]